MLYSSRWKLCLIGFHNEIVLGTKVNSWIVILIFPLYLLNLVCKQVVVDNTTNHLLLLGVWNCL
jgi:hypothetical protein